ncbi:MAG: tetratricopeptide repeat protein [Ferrovum sp.]|nr:tetratricopeptide repeat protein [Ferrovum sp.]NDU87626.1 tetratricopeptide repeat protein [Ferrovum sp.]
MYDLEEQEQIDALKAWWRQYGKWVMTGCMVGIFGFVGIKGWDTYQKRQAEAAGKLLEAVRVAARTGDAPKTLVAARVLQSQYDTSPLAARGALIAAAVSHVRGDDKDAEGELQWVILHSTEPPMGNLARLRLAGLWADQKKYDAALHLLTDEKTPEFAALTLDLKGDILLAMNRLPEARVAYKQATEKSQPMDALHQLDQTKWEALGGER